MKVPLHSRSIEREKTDRSTSILKQRITLHYEEQIKLQEIADQSGIIMPDNKYRLKWEFFITL